MLPSDRLLVMVAPNGARRTKADHPALPIEPSELAQAAADAVAAGAAAIHLHVRDEDGRHTLDPGRYHEAIAAIRERVGPDPLIQVTSESVGRYGPTEQMAMVRAVEPRAVSLAVREIVPDDAPETLRAARDFFVWLEEAGIWPQFILYTPEDVARLRTLQHIAVLRMTRTFVLLVLGRGTTLDRLSVMLATLDPDHPERPVDWMVCGFGPLELPVAGAAIALGGHVRVGFENNLRLVDGRPAPDNAALVGRLRPLWETLGRPPLTPAELRRLLAAHPADA